MSVILLANVGTRDVNAPGLTFPDECYAPNKTLLARVAGRANAS